jgi:hypothetical protein
MTNKQKIRRAGKRWRENAPDIFVDAFDHGDKYADRYWVIVLPAFEYDGKHYASVLGSSENLTFSGWRELQLYEIAQYRYKNSRNRIAWNDLPEKIRGVIIEDATEFSADSQ